MKTAIGARLAVRGSDMSCWWRAGRPRPAWTFRLPPRLRSGLRQDRADSRDARPSTVSSFRAATGKFTSHGVVTSRRLATLRQVMLQQEKGLLGPGTQRALLRLQARAREVSGTSARRSKAQQRSAVVQFLWSRPVAMVFMSQPRRNQILVAAPRFSSWT